MNLEPLEVKKSYSGSLVEAFKFPHDGQLFYLIVKPGETRGNHYHLRKTENFLVIYGSATISVRDRDSGNVMNVELTGERPTVVKISPNHTHSLTATEEGAIVMVWVDELYDPTDSDTYTEEL